MYIHGHFYNTQGERIELHILSGTDRTEEVEIGTEGGDLQWTDDPIEIEAQADSTMDHLMAHQAYVRLQCRWHVAELFSASPCDVAVEILRQGEVVFAGYVEPMALQQNYEEEYDEVELTCIDAIGTLSYANYRNIDTTGEPYATAKRSAQMRPWADILKEIFAQATSRLPIVGSAEKHIWYDGSRALDSAAENRYKLMEQIAQSELLFMGDEADDLWTQQEVVEEMMRYLDLHCMQQGLDIYLFSWQSLRQGSEIEWHDLLSTATQTTEAPTIDISLDTVEGDGTQISIGEVWNQLRLTCDVDAIDTMVSNPLDDEQLSSPYTNYQKYLTEYSSGGEGERAYKAMYNMIKEIDTTYDAADKTDWYVRVMQSADWTFKMYGNTGNEDLLTFYCKDGKNQQELLQYLGSNIGAAIIQTGSVKTYMTKKDNSPTSVVQMQSQLVVAVCGNGKDDANATPTSAQLRAYMPVAVYQGAEAGVFSPADDDTTNYIVVSGKIRLVPVKAETATYFEMHGDWGDSSTVGSAYYKYWHKTVADRQNADGRYYTRQYWKAETPATEPQTDWTGDGGWYPPTDADVEQYEYKRTRKGSSDKVDEISKVPVLACMLIIGDKCMREKTPSDDLGDTDSDGNPIPYTDNPEEAYRNFVWCPYKTAEQCSSMDEYYSQSFTIGFDPKIGDKLIGNDFDMQRTFSSRLGIEAEGIAIAIRAKDRLSGKVHFEILGPVNSVYGTSLFVSNRTWDIGPWASMGIPLMSHVSSIVVKDFEVKLYSDQGGENIVGKDRDLVYTSQTDESYINRKDDIQMKICSALTTNERRQLGVKSAPSRSVPEIKDTQQPLVEIYDAAEDISDKPERLYLDRYWQEYHRPRIEIEQTLRDASAAVRPWNRYRYPSLDKTMHIVGIDRNLEDGTATVRMKEI